MKNKQNAGTTKPEHGPEVAARPPAIEKRSTGESETDQIEPVRPVHVVPCIAAIVILVSLLLWFGDPNDLHATTFRNAFLGVGFVLLLKGMTAVVRSSDWDWLSLLDWKSPLMAILIQINMAKPFDDLPGDSDFSGWATASIVAVGLFFAGFEGRATSSISRAVTATSGFAWAMMFALAAGYSENFDKVDIDMLKFGL